METEQLDIAHPFLARGRALRDKRHATTPYLSLNALSRESGIDIVELCAMERGRVEPGKLEEWWHRELTPEEADAAYLESPADPISDEEVERLVRLATREKQQ